LQYDSWRKQGLCGCASEATFGASEEKQKGQKEQKKKFLLPFSPFCLFCFRALSLL
jgi:hypothetical protein